MLIRNPILRLLLGVRVDESSCCSCSCRSLFVASAAGCLGPQRHSEVAAIADSSGSYRDVVRHGGHATWREGCHGDNDVDRGRVYGDNRL